MVKQIGNTLGQSKVARTLRRRDAVLFAMAAIATASTVANVQAHTYWNNTSTDFNSASSWNGGLPSPTQDAQFNVAQTNQPNVTANITVDSLGFAYNGYTLSSSGSYAITFNATPNNIISVGGGSNTSPWTTNISASLVLGGGAGVTQEMFVSNYSTLNLSGVISGTDGTLLLNGGGGTGSIYNITGINTYSADTALSGTTVNLIGSGTLGTGSVMVGNYGPYGGTLNVTNSTGLGSNDVFINNGTLTDTGGGTLGSGNVTVNIGTVNINTTTTTINNLTLNDGGSINVNGNNGGGLTAGTLVTFAGGRFNLFGNVSPSTTPTSVTLGDPTFNPGGQSTIEVDSQNNSNAKTTLTIGNNWTRNTGATASIYIPFGTGAVLASSPIAGANPSATSAILPYLVVNNAGFATVNASGDVVQYTNAATLPVTGALSTTNYKVSPTPTTTLSGSETVNSLQITSSSTANTTVDLGGGTLSITSGGLLLNGGNSAYSTTIQNGQLGTSNQELIIQDYAGSSVLNLNAGLTGGSGNVTIAGGTNTINVGATNSYTGNTYINDIVYGGKTGTVELSATQPLGTGTLYLYSQPTLVAERTASGITVPNSIVLGGEAQTGIPNTTIIENNDPNNPFTITGGITGTTGVSNVSFTNPTPSVNNPIVLSGTASNIAGSFTVTSGELVTSSDITVASAVGGPNVGWSVHSGASVVQNGGTVTLGIATIPIYNTIMDGSYTLNSGVLDVYNGIGYGGLHVGYSGTPSAILTVNGGALTVESGTGLGNALMVSQNNQGTSNATVIQNGGVVTAGSVVINGGSTSTVAGNGLYELNGGTLVTGSIGGQSNYGSSTFDFNGGTVVAGVSNGNFMQGLNTANVQAGGAIIDTNSFNDTISQALVHDATLGSTPDGGLAKNGLGILTLNGADTYTGATTIATGTLQLSSAGTIADSSAIDVQSGATFDVSAKTAGFTLGAAQTLEGAGTVSTGGHTLTIDGTVTPGSAGIGTLTIDPASMVFGADSSLTIDIAGANNGLLAVDGNLNLSGANDTLDINGTLTAASYIIASYTGSLTGTFTNLVNLQGYTINYGSGTNSDITLLQPANVPEPAALSLMAACGAMILLGKRRRKSA